VVECNVPKTLAIHDSFAPRSTSAIDNNVVQSHDPFQRFKHLQFLHCRSPTGRNATNFNHSQRGPK
jgi:hypothetical protein